jgi:Tfp pilus assembly protein PilO
MKLVEELNKIDLVNKLALDQKKIILIIIMSVMFLYLDFNFIFKAQTAGLNKTTQELLKVKNDFKVFDAGVKSMQAIKASQGSTKSQVKLKNAIYEIQIASLIQDISKIAQANNVKIMQIKPSKDNAKASSVAGKFSPVFIWLDLTCGYHDLGRFINALENNQVLISVDNLKIGSQQQDVLKQKVTLTLKTYVKK